MPYFGHVCEAFCLSLAEAQALGLPAVVARIGALPERVIDGVTGFHLQRDDEAGFAEATIALLTDDALWRRQHEKALALQQGWSWRDYAAAFEAKLLQ
jgi:glycosyltransferase involved in cell wall biosynthesis